MIFLHWTSARTLNACTASPSNTRNTHMKGVPSYISIFFPGWKAELKAGRWPKLLLKKPEFEKSEEPAVDLLVLVDRDLKKKVLSCHRMIRNGCEVSV